MANILTRLKHVKEAMLPVCYWTWRNLEYRESGDCFQIKTVFQVRWPCNRHMLVMEILDTEKGLCLKSVPRSSKVNATFCWCRHFIISIWWRYVLDGFRYYYCPQVVPRDLLAPSLLGSVSTATICLDGLRWENLTLDHRQMTHINYIFRTNGKRSLLHHGSLWHLAIFSHWYCGGERHLAAPTSACLSARLSAHRHRP